MIIILAPLAWVLIMSIKSRPDSMRGALLAAQVRLHPLQLRLRQDRHAADQPLQQHLRDRGDGAAHRASARCSPAMRWSTCKPRGAGIVIAVLLVSLYLPMRVVSIISIYEIQNFLGLINVTSGLILPYVTLNLAISVLIMRAMFQLVPHEMIEAARMDGAGHWRILWSIGLPLVRNGLVVIFIVNFVTAWGEFLLVHDADQRPGRAHHAGGARRPRRAASASGPGRRSPPSTSSSSRPASSPSPSPRSCSSRDWPKASSRGRSRRRRDRQRQAVTAAAAASRRPFRTGADRRPTFAGTVVHFARPGRMRTEAGHGADRGQACDDRSSERRATPVSGDDVGTLQALLNLFLTAGDIGEDGTPILPLTVDGIAGAKTKRSCARLPDGGPVLPPTPSSVR